MQNQVQTMTMQMDALQEVSAAKSAHDLDVQARLERMERMLAHDLDMQARLERMGRMLSSGNAYHSQWHSRRSSGTAVGEALNANGP